MLVGSHTHPSQLLQEVHQDGDRSLCSPILCPSIPYFPGGMLGCAHPSRVLQEFPRMEMGSHAHPAVSIPAGGVLGWSQGTPSLGPGQDAVNDTAHHTH